jgi:hypothetical protein
MGQFDIRIPGLTLVEPLRSRPFLGATYGTATGALFGLLAQRIDWATGYIVAGLIAGAIIGAALPLFRRRWVAGAIVAAATMPALAIVFRSLHEKLPFGGLAFLAAALGFIYARLLWEYQPASAPLTDASTSASRPAL